MSSGWRENIRSGWEATCRRQLSGKRIKRRPLPGPVVDLSYGTYQILVAEDGREIVARIDLLSGQRSPEHDRPPLPEGRKCRIKRWHRHEVWRDTSLDHKPCPQFLNMARKRIHPPEEEAGVEPAA